MSGTLPEPSCIHFGIDKHPGKHNLYNSSSIFAVKFPLPLTAADSSPERKGVVPRKHSSKQSQSRNSYGGFRIWRFVTAIPSKSANTGLLQTIASVAGWEVSGEEVT